MHDEQDHTIIDNQSDFIGWSIFFLERWKEGVCRVHMRQEMNNGNGTVMLMVYCKDKHLPYPPKV